MVLFRMATACVLLLFTQSLAIAHETQQRSGSRGYQTPEEWRLKPGTPEDQARQITRFFEAGRAYYAQDAMRILFAPLDRGNTAQNLQVCDIVFSTETLWFILTRDDIETTNVTSICEAAQSASFFFWRAMTWEANYYLASDPEFKFEVAQSMIQDLRTARDLGHPDTTPALRELESKLSQLSMDAKNAEAQRIIARIKEILRANPR